MSDKKQKATSPLVGDGSKYTKVVMVCLSLITLNVNGIHDPVKRSSVFQCLPSMDIVCLLETHLCTLQERAFCTQSPKYDCFFSHGTTNSGGVCIGLRRKAELQGELVGDISGHGLCLDLKGHEPLQLITVYVPPIPKSHKLFFENLEQWMGHKNILLGDFNLVINSTDQLSGNLDSTLQVLDNLLLEHKFYELLGSHTKVFTYHHPSVSSQKSHIDRIYMNFDSLTSHSYAHPLITILWVCSDCQMRIMDPNSGDFHQTCYQRLLA